MNSDDKSFVWMLIVTGGACLALVLAQVYGVFK